MAARTGGVTEVGGFGGCRWRRGHHAKHGDGGAHSEDCQLTLEPPDDCVGRLPTGYLMEALAQGTLSSMGVAAITDNPVGACKVSEHAGGGDMLVS